MDKNQNVLNDFIVNFIFLYNKKFNYRKIKRKK